MKLIIFTCIILTSYAITSAQNKALYMKNTAIFRAPVPTYSTLNITMEFWIKPERDDEHSYPLFLGSNFFGYGIHLHNGVNGGPGNYASLMIQSASNSITGNPIRLKINTWTHIAITHDTLGWRFYRNGEYVGNGEFRAIIDSTSLLRILYFTGTIDEIRLWGITRTQQEIKQSFQKPLKGNEKGLIEYYNMDSFAQKFGEIIPNIAGDSTKNAAIYGDVQNIANVEGAPLVEEEYPDITFLEKPSHYQFFPRNDQTNSAPIRITGSINTPGWDSVVLQTLKNDTVSERTSYPLAYSGTTAKFEFNSTITATPTLFTYRVYVHKGEKRIMIGESADLSCGDVYLISGQSNSHPASDSSTYVNPLLKSWGVLNQNGNLLPYNVIDSSWGMANGHGFNYFFHAACGPYMTCEWGIELQRLILEKYRIPTCIINVGAGSSSVYQNLRDDSSRMNLNTIYGRGLYRATKAKVDKGIKGIFWFQGESDSDFGYEDNFNKLYNAWKEDYPNAKKVYVYQIRPGCPGPNHSALREVQRNFQKKYPDIKTLATSGIDGFDGCHYYHRGYINIANNTFLQVERDFYGSTDSLNITSPNVERAFYSSPDHDEIKIIYSQKNDEFKYPNKFPYTGKMYSIEDYFYLDGKSGNIKFGKFNKDTLTLSLIKPSYATTITYLPENYYNQYDSVIYQGPWITNRKGIGAFTFYNVPIESPATTVVNELTIDKTVSYNSLSGVLQVTNTSTSPADFSIAYFNLIGQVITWQSLLNLSMGVHSIPIPAIETNQVIFVRVIGNGTVNVLPIIR